MNLALIPHLSEAQTCLAPDSPSQSSACSWLEHKPPWLATHGTSKTRPEQSPLSKPTQLHPIEGKWSWPPCDEVLWILSSNNDDILKGAPHHELRIINMNIQIRTERGQWPSSVQWGNWHSLCWRMKGIPHVLLAVFIVRCKPPHPSTSSPPIVLRDLSKAKIMWKGFIILFSSQALFTQQRRQSSIWHWFILIYLERAALESMFIEPAAPSRPPLFTDKDVAIMKHRDKSEQLSSGHSFRDCVAQYHQTKLC